MTSTINNNTSDNDIKLQNEEAETTNGRTVIMSPNPLSPLLNNEALRELEDAAFFLLDEDDHHILSTAIEKDDNDATDENKIKEEDKEECHNYNKENEKQKENNNINTSTNNFIMNAVHMEVQENAKVSTLPVSVNRSNSTAGTFLLRKPHYVREIIDHSTNNNNRERSLSIDAHGSSTGGGQDVNDVDEANTLIDGFKLAELFLLNNERYVKYFKFEKEFQKGRESGKIVLDFEISKFLIRKHRSKKIR